MTRHRNLGGGSVTIDIRLGDALTVLKTLPDESVQCCVTSPPYWGLRDYAVVGQLGLERTPEAYVETMVSAFREVRRVLRKDGTLWLNIGDSYCAAPKGSLAGQDKSGLTSTRAQENAPCGVSKLAPRVGRNPKAGQGNADVAGAPHRRKLAGYKPKDLIGIPWMLALALRSDGWYLRAPIIWAKPNGMPGSQKDRPTISHEYVWLLSKSRRYFYDWKAERTPLAASSVARLGQPTLDQQQGSLRANGGAKTNGPMKAVKFGGSKYGAKDRETGAENAGNLGDFRNRERQKSLMRDERDGGSGGGSPEFTREREREREFTANRTYSGKEWRGL